MGIEDSADRCPPPLSLEIAVVGAGISGLTCARSLVDNGQSVRVFDKGRSVGGRMSTRRGEGRSFDHGAQYFTVRDDRFGRQVESWRRRGLVESWAGSIAVLAEGFYRTKDGGVERLVGVPVMSVICRDLASGLEVELATQVGPPVQSASRWRLTSAAGTDLGSFDAVVFTAPAQQTAELLAPVASELAARARAVGIAPCWAAMVEFPRALGLGFDGAFVERSALSWVARDGSKPGRPAGERWVLHATPDWSRRHLELEAGEVACRLIAAFESAVGGLGTEPEFLHAHRWRFALPTEPLSETCLFDDELMLGACGDWCGGPRVEGAFLSGLAMADRLLALARAALGPNIVER